MSLKKIAVRGMFLLILILFLCLFFAQTWISMRSPNIKLASPYKGTIKVQHNTLGEWSYESIEDVILYEAKYYPIVVEKILVEPGDMVKRGDVLMRTRLGAEYELALSGIQNRHMELQANIARLEFEFVKRGGRHNSRDLECVINRVEMASQEFNLQMEILKKAKQCNLAMNDDTEQWERYLKLKEYEPLHELLQKWEIIRESLSESEQSKRYRGISEEAYSYYLDWWQLTKNIEEAQAEAKNLSMLGDSLQFIRAEQDGIILSIPWDEGEVYEGVLKLYSITYNNKVCIFVSMDGLPAEEIKVGSICEFELSGKKVNGIIEKIIWREVDAQVKQYAQITSEDMPTKASVKGEIPVSFINESTIFPCVIPLSCIVKESGVEMVYIVEKRSGVWGEELYIRKEVVKTALSNKQYAALTTPLLPGVQLAQYWNRPIEDGDRVVVAP